MSIYSDVEYWKNRNWDALSETFQSAAREFEKARKAYIAGVKEGLLEAKPSDLPFSFSMRSRKKSVFSINEITQYIDQVLAADPYNTPKEVRIKFITDLEKHIEIMSPESEAYYLAF